MKIQLLFMGILGSVAGDDTILIVARKPEEIPLLIDKLESYLD